MENGIASTATAPVPSEAKKPERPFLRFVGNAAITEMERKQQETQTKQQADPALSGLSGFIQKVWETNKKFKEESGIEADLLSNLRQRNCEYELATLAKIREMGGSEIFIGLTGVKCRAAVAWVKDVLTGQQPWKLTPSPLPDLPPHIGDIIAQRAMLEVGNIFQSTGEVMSPDKVFDFAVALRNEVEAEQNEEAIRRSDGMEKKVHDELVEGKWNEAFDDLIEDIVTLRVGIIKGPVLYKVPRLRWRKNQIQGSRTIPVVEQVLRQQFSRVSPFDIYPSPGAEGLDPEDGDLIERERLSPKALRDMKGGEGYNDDAIDAVLSEFSSGRFSNWTAVDETRAQLEGKVSKANAYNGLIEALEFWGNVQGKVLIVEGIFADDQGKTIDPLEMYEINSIKIGPYIVYRRFNPDPLGRRTYSKTVWEKVPGSFWGRSVPDQMRDLQKICNAAMRSLVFNMAMASGPMVSINDTSRLPPGTKVDSLHNWQVWQFLNGSNSQLPPLSVFNIDSHAPELIGIYNQCSKMADDYTGIPAYSYGSDQVAGAGRTASGLSMLMNSAARGIKRVIARIDLDVIQTVIRRLVDWNMQYDSDESIKGDVEIQPVGPLAQIMKEQMMARRMEFMNQTANPADAQIIGPEQRAVVWREQAKLLELPVDKVVKSEGAIKAIQKALQEQQAMMIAQQQAQAQSQAAGQGVPATPVGVQR